MIRYDLRKQTSCCHLVSSACFLVFMQVWQQFQDWHAGVKGVYVHPAWTYTDLLYLTQLIYPSFFIFFQYGSGINCHRTRAAWTGNAQWVEPHRAGVLCNGCRMLRVLRMRIWKDSGRMDVGSFKGLVRDFIKFLLSVFSTWNHGVKGRVWKIWVAEDQGEFEKGGLHSCLKFCSRFGNCCSHISLVVPISFHIRPYCVLFLLFFHVFSSF